MAFEIKIDEKRYQQLVADAEKVKGLLSYDAPALTAASVAIIGRSNVDRRLSSVINIGQPYSKWKRDGGSYSVERKTYAVKRRDLDAWASSTRTSGGKPWLLSRYSWETKSHRGKRNPFITARFTSTLANLLAYDTKTYSRNSPPFQQGSGMHVIRKGTKRKGIRSVWTVTTAGIEGAQILAISRAERHLIENKDFSLLGGKAK